MNTALPPDPEADERQRELDAFREHEEARSTAQKFVDESQQLSQRTSVQVSAFLAIVFALAALAAIALKGCQ